MKKIILTLSGVLFVIVTGCSLLICMMNGIPNLDQPAAAFYLAKAILLSFSFPLVTLGLFVHCLQLRRKLDKKNLLFRNAMKELIKNRQTSCRDSGDSDFQSFKNSLTCLFCAFAEDSDLSEKDQKDLLDFIDKF